MKKFYTLLFLLGCFPFILFAQFGDVKVLHEQLGQELYRANSMAIADFNNDGFVDVVYSTERFGKTVLYLNNGDGTFQPQQSIAYGKKFDVITPGDMNNDGKVDIVVASVFPAEIGWLENLGNGNFKPYQLITEDFGGGFTIQVSDIDGDNDSDILFSSNFENLISWIEQTSNGEFIVQDPIIIGHSIVETKAFDVDEDGDMDIIPLIFGDFEFGWYKNDGNENFEWTIIEDSITLYTAFQIADINNDSHLDFVVTTQNGGGTNYFKLYINNGNSQFILSDSIETPNVVKNLLIYDFNGNGHKDFVFLESNEIAWMENNGNLNFSNVTNFEIDAYELTNIDVNADNKLDLFSNHLNNENGFWLEHDNLLDNNPIEKQIIGDTSHQGELSGNLLFRKQSNTNYLDIFFGEDGVEENTNAFRNLTNNGTNTFTLPPAQFSTPHIPYHHYFDGDINGDGISDVLFIKDYTSSFGWLEFDTNGNVIQEHNVFFEPSQGVFQGIIGLKDMNQDGTLDVLLQSKTSGPSLYSIDIYGNDGNGNFSLINSIGHLDRRFDITEIGDIDNDSDNDIIAVNDDVLYWFKNQGNNVFSDSIQLESPARTGYSISSVEFQIADLEGDGDIEVFAYYYFTQCLLHCPNPPIRVKAIYDFDQSDLVIINENNSWPYSALSLSYFTPHYNDVNHDNNIDILVSSGSNNNFKWRLGDGTGNFLSTLLVVNGNFRIEYFAKPSAADIDNDGDLDVILYQPGVQNTAIMLFENLEFTTIVDEDNDGFFSNIDCDDSDSTISDVLNTPEISKGIDICEGDDLQVLITNVNDGLDYQWSGPQSYSSSDTNLAINSIAANQGGTYNVTSSINQCTSLAGQIDVAVLPTNPQIIFENDVLSATESFNTYQWLLNGDEILGATEATFQPLESGNYSVAISTSDGCEAVSNVIQVTILGLWNNANSAGLTIYPNPVGQHQQIFIELESNRQVEKQYTIFDIAGSIVNQGNFYGNSAAIRLNNISKGVYLLKIQSEDQQWIQKLEIQ